jgi:hypothetical protein
MLDSKTNDQRLGSLLWVRASRSPVGAPRGVGRGRDGHGGARGVGRGVHDGDRDRRVSVPPHGVVDADEESVLLEKGVADEEDLEAARRRFGDDAVRYVRGRDGEIH